MASPLIPESQGLEGTKGQLESLSLNQEEKDLLGELLEAERAKLLVEIRHTDHRAYKERLRQRLEVVERLIQRCKCS